MNKTEGSKGPEPNSLVLLKPRVGVETTKKSFPGFYSFMSGSSVDISGHAIKPPENLKYPYFLVLIAITPREG